MNQNTNVAAKLPEHAQELVKRGYSVKEISARPGKFRWWIDTGSDGVSVPKQGLSDDVFQSAEEAWHGARLDAESRGLVQRKLPEEQQVDRAAVAEWAGLHHHVDFDRETPAKQQGLIERYIDMHSANPDAAMYEREQRKMHPDADLELLRSKLPSGVFDALLAAGVAIYQFEDGGVSHAPEDAGKWFVSTSGNSPLNAVEVTIPLADSEAEAWVLAANAFENHLHLPETTRNNIKGTQRLISIDLGSILLLAVLLVVPGSILFNIIVRHARPDAAAIAFSVGFLGIDVLLLREFIAKRSSSRVNGRIAATNHEVRD